MERITRNSYPLTEDAVFLRLLCTLLDTHQSQVYRKVRTSRETGGYGRYRYFRLTPGVDLLEVRPCGTLVGYELKGFRKNGNRYNPPA